MIDPGLTDKVVLITGANNPYGIGAAIGRAFAAQGSRVFLHFFAPGSGLLSAKESTRLVHLVSGSITPNKSSLQTRYSATFAPWVRKHTRGSVISQTQARSHRCLTRPNAGSGQSTFWSTTRRTGKQIHLFRPAPN